MSSASYSSCISSTKRVHQVSHPTTREAQPLESKVQEISQGPFQLDRLNDNLRASIGTPEHPKRLRGQGSRRMSHSKCATRAEVDAKLAEFKEKLVAQFMGHFQSLRAQLNLPPLPPDTFKLDRYNDNFNAKIGMPENLERLRGHSKFGRRASHSKCITRAEVDARLAQLEDDLKSQFMSQFESLQAEINLLKGTTREIPVKKEEEEVSSAMPGVRESCF